MTDDLPQDNFTNGFIVALVLITAAKVLAEGYVEPPRSFGLALGGVAGLGIYWFYWGGVPEKLLTRLGDDILDSQEWPVPDPWYLTSSGALMVAIGCIGLLFFMGIVVEAIPFGFLDPVIGLVVLFALVGAIVFGGISAIKAFRVVFQ